MEERRRERKGRRKGGRQRGRRNEERKEGREEGRDVGFTSAFWRLCPLSVLHEMPFLLYSTPMSLPLPSHFFILEWLRLRGLNDFSSTSCYEIPVAPKVLCSVCNKVFLPALPRCYLVLRVQVKTGVRPPRRGRARTTRWCPFSLLINWLLITRWVLSSPLRVSLSLCFSTRLKSEVFWNLKDRCYNTSGEVFANI